MRTKNSHSLADALFGKTRQVALGVLFSNPGRSLYLREIARLGGVSAAAMYRELESLVAAGIVLDERRGNLRLFRANPATPIFAKIKGIVAKTSGIADQVKQALLDCEGIDMAFIFGSVARGEDRADSDVDVLIIGASCSYHDILLALTEAETQISRPINSMVFTPAEFRARVAESNAFVKRVLGAPKIFLIGNEKALTEQ